MKKIIELKEELGALREEAIKDANEDFGLLDHEQKQAWFDRNERMEALRSEISELQVVEKARQTMNDEEAELKSVEPSPIHEEKTEPVKSLSEQIVESDAYQAYVKNGQKNVNSELKWNPLTEYKTLMDEANQYPPKVVRSDLIIPTALRNPNSVIDLFSTIPTDQFQYKYLEETTFTNNAAEVAEAAAFGESALAMTEKTEEIRKVGVSIPVTEELLADVSSVQGYLDSRLRTMLNLRLDDVLIGGSGVAPILKGLLNVSGINTFNFSSYAGNLGRIGQLHQAITEIRKDAFMEPDAIIMHPSDWNDTVTEVTADFAGTSGQGYAAKNPLFVTAGNYQSGVTPNIWGLKVVPTTAISAGTVLMGTFGGGLAAHIVTRAGISVAMSDSHSDFFTKDKVMMKASMRVGFPVYRPAAFCSITNY